MSVQDEWSSVALPILVRVSEGEATDAGAATSEVLAKAGADRKVHSNLVALLEDGYIGGATPHRPIGRPQALIVADIIHLTPKGRRAVGLWPSEASIQSALQGLLIELADRQEAVSPEEASKLRAAAGVVGRMGLTVLTDLASRFAAHAAGLP